MDLKEKGYSKCQVCEKEINSKSPSYFKVTKFVVGCEGMWFTCSPSCLVELAWGLKEKQQKLSKSAKVEEKA